MGRKINYRGLFVAGCTLLCAGVALSITLGPVGIGLVGAGMGMMAIGLSHRGESGQEE